MKQRIEARFRSLQPDPEKPVFQLVDAAHPLRFYIGRQITGGCSLLLVDKQKAPHIVGLRSLKVESFARGEGEWAFHISLEENELLGLFCLLCEDLISATSDFARGTSGVDFVARRVEDWRRLLERGSADLLTNSEIRGLFGELWFLDWLVAKIAPPSAIKTWVGPTGADQDFSIGSKCVEIKTKHPGIDCIQIASERQLDAGTRALDLVVLELTEMLEAGDSLSCLVGRLRAKLLPMSDARELFERRLGEARYSARPEYDLPLFKVSDVQGYCIDEHFPRLHRHCLPTGVRDVTYMIDLSTCKANFSADGMEGTLNGT
jgi:hypothetical protein